MSKYTKGIILKMGRQNFKHFKMSNYFLHQFFIFAIVGFFHEIQATYWKDLSFEEGDVIFCKGFAKAPDHFLLAINDTSVAHLVNSAQKPEEAELIEELWETYQIRKGEIAQINCFHKFRAESPSLAIAAARKDIERFRGRKVYYNWAKCNSEHWVNNWALGFPKAGNNRNLDSINALCEITGQRTSHGKRCESTCIQDSKGEFKCGVTSHKGHYRSEDHSIKAADNKPCSYKPGVTSKGKRCVSECVRYNGWLYHYYYCYTNGRRNWDYCGPTN